MDSWMEFALERYNYWIVIVLMMTGLYIVFARGNLVKKLVGLNLFQTSVFIFYITIGKIAGGTAPIYIGGELDHGGGHDGAGEGHEGAGEALHEAPAHDAADSANAIGAHGEAAGDLHSKIDNAALNAPVNDLKAALGALEPASGDSPASLHAGAETAAKISNDALSAMPKPEAGGFDIAGEAASQHAAGGANALDAVHGAAEIIYTNPVPHVLILTAIVVGVATTAVGLALAVRIREAYGSIEEDELEAADDIAEFGEGYVAGGAA